MGYHSTITFTLDTICPWTYPSLLLLQTAHRTANPSSPVTFELQLAPGTVPQVQPRRHRPTRTPPRLKAREIHPVCDYMRIARPRPLPSTSAAVDREYGHAHRTLQCVQERHGREAAVSALASLYPVVLRVRIPVAPRRWSRRVARTHPSREAGQVVDSERDGRGNDDGGTGVDGERRG
ncbi:hypothetical protein EKO04_009041 [Ascochyta lentis]|uniref:Uncharacterized protein n=1 Tax=Ascochyta lentis TaxID=205686 RepID=A0A8H7IV42_9PLEO|nr:hypothetical protein EKO04_009041 [Ascochyta lentis]